MSYILDALRKSERERRRGSIPDPLTVQEPLPHEKRRRAVWPFIIMAALLINAVIFGLWFGSRYSQKAPVFQEEASQNIHTPQQANNLPQSAPQTKDEQKNIPIKNIPHTGKLSPDVLNSQEHTKSREHPVRKGEETNHDITRISPGNTMSASETEKEIPPPDKTKLYSLNELPSSVRQKLPDFSLSVFLYADEPASRMVRVNGNTMKEGQYLSSGLKLEEIIPDGVIFSYLNYRFRIGIQ
jgi:general secretion pathway protein B